jgi:hypothetical protein
MLWYPYKYLIHGGGGGAESQALNEMLRIFHVSGTSCYVGLPTGEVADGVWPSGGESSSVRRHGHTRVLDWLALCDSSGEGFSNNTVCYSSWI